jgi:phage baseplate assembly protein W
MSGISVSLPITRDRQDGFELLKDYNDVATQNLKMLVLTMPGERIMDPEFGVGARRFLFEQMTQETFERFKSSLLQQQEKYLPYITIQDVKFSSALTNENVQENTLGIQIIYYNNILKTSNTLLLPITP